MTIAKSVLAAGFVLGAAVTIGGCALEDESVEEIEDVETTDVVTLAELTVPGGIEVQFAVDDIGGIIVSEVAPVSGVSPISTLMDGEGATPLELFMALADDVTEPPVELVRAHRDEMALEGIDQEPRKLSLETALADAKTNGTLSATAANCNLSSDGAVFDFTRNWLGWNWSYYWRTNADYSNSATTPRRRKVRSHLCNDGPRGEKEHRLKKSACTTGGGIWSYVDANRVRPEYRSTINYSASSGKCYFENIVNKPIGSNNDRPTYSHGIMTP